MLQIIFDQDWPSGFRDIWKCGRGTDNGPLVYCKLTLWVFGLGELKTNNIISWHYHLHPQILYKWRIQLDKNECTSITICLIWVVKTIINPITPRVPVNVQTVITLPVTGSPWTPNLITEVWAVNTVIAAEGISPETKAGVTLEPLTIWNNHTVHIGRYHTPGNQVTMDILSHHWGPSSQHSHCNRKNRHRDRGWSHTGTLDNLK